VALPALSYPNGMPAFAMLVVSGMAASNSEARRWIKDGSVRIDGVIVQNETQIILPKPKLDLSVGKKRHMVVRFVE
jgi:tyrosyl-tRNA synthetase